ncbi:iron complex outermembrane recepter protein [Chryseobacterium taeanense]|uniref:Iron complex outermembrane recepter protein n=1 Tax=Chryseobacterium taeanense TaxID=311334 RepID=A0A1G8HY89_9FLAO|nr:TonB-dependent receptor [Chryseobacterium taeanense]SDI11603.1 iron complex outermembrane recepter protein [Chryseobacterium taeanense]
MDIKKSLVLIFSAYGCLLSAQEKAIDTVYIFDNQMSKVKLFHKVNTISPEDAQKNSTNLSETLRFQSQIYIKENGRGAVSSPSFRGTTAQQTAFVWNGININSQFLGQGDVNNIPFMGFDQLDVKSGSVGVVYGSGAIGGTVHLNNSLSFNKGFHASIFSEVASFSTYNNFAKASFSNEKFSFKFSGNYSESENDYKVEESRNYINRNGEYSNTNFNISAAYKIAPHHQLSWITELFNGNQHFPVFLDDYTKTKYETQNVRTLLVWDWNTSKLSNLFRAAYTEENFQYFDNIDQPKSSGGTGKNYILKNDFNYFLTSKWNINVIGEFQVNKAEGYMSGIKDVSRNVGSLAGLLRYFATNDLRFEAGIKKDFVEDYSSPVLLSFSGNWNVTNWYNLNLNAAKNFRYPSFNDLYWSPGGNMNLKPETAYQFDLKNQFKIAGAKITLTPYYIRITDMITWLPSNMGYYSPVNTYKVQSYGLDSQFEYEKKFGKHILKTNLGYSYTKSINLETKKKLMYVPLHKFFGNIDYQYSCIKLYVQGMYNGLTYTDTEEKQSAALKPYFVMNAGVAGTFMKKYTIGGKVNNIFNEIYQTTAFYPLPKRNYSIYLNINF